MKPKQADPADAAAEHAAKVEDILERAQKGDRSVLPFIRECLEKPGAVETLGNLARRVQSTMVESVTGGNLVMSEALTKKLEAMRDELAGKDPTPLERQLVERVVLCWLAVHDAELRGALTTKLAPDQGEYWQLRIDHAHKRHLSAIKTLATVRKLALPALQVNIARKQVNVVGAAAE